MNWSRCYSSHTVFKIPKLQTQEQKGQSMTRVQGHHPRIQSPWSHSLSRGNCSFQRGPSAASPAVRRGRDPGPAPRERRQLRRASPVLQWIQPRLFLPAPPGAQLPQAPPSRPPSLPASLRTTPQAGTASFTPHWRALPPSPLASTARQACFPGFESGARRPGRARTGLGGGDWAGTDARGRGGGGDLNRAGDRVCNVHAGLIGCVSLIGLEKVIGRGWIWRKRQTRWPQGLGEGRAVVRIVLQAAGERARLRDDAKGLFITHDRGERENADWHFQEHSWNCKISLLKELRMKGRCETEGRT